MTTPPPLDDETMAALEALFARPDLPEGSVSPRMLSRFAVGDLSRAEAREVAEALREDPDLAAQLQAFKDLDARFDAELPWDAISEAVHSRAAQLDEELEAKARADFGVSPARFWRAMLMGLAGAVAVITLAFLIDSADPTLQGETPLTSRYKGADTLAAYVWSDGRAQRLEAGARLAAGDRIQFRVSTAHTYIALLGVDGTGTVSRYLPVGAEMSAAFTPGNAQPIADSFQLDDSPGPEVFVAFLSDEPLLVEDLERAVHDIVTEGLGARALVDTDWGGLAPQVGVFLVEKDAS